MVPEPKETEIDDSDIPDFGVDGGGEEANRSGEAVVGVRETAPQVLLEKEHPAAPGKVNGTAGDGGGGEVSADENGSHPPTTGDKVRRHNPKRYFISTAEAAQALKASGGDRAIAAAALRISHERLALKIRSTPDLKMFWGESDPPKAPTESEVMNLKTDDLPSLPTMSPRTIELAQMVSDTESALLRKKLHEYGATDQTIKRLKMLDGLSPSAGQFLAMSLQTVHRSYFVQTIQLSELAEALYDKLKSPDCQWRGEELAFFYRCYTDMVKQGGVALKTMMEGTAAIVAMVKASSGDKENTGVKAKPGWGQGAKKRTNAKSPD